MAEREEEFEGVDKRAEDKDAAVMEDEDERKAEEEEHHWAPTSASLLALRATMYPYQPASKHTHTEEMEPAESDVDGAEKMDERREEGAENVVHIGVGDSQPDAQQREEQGEAEEEEDEEVVYLAP